MRMKSELIFILVAVFFLAGCDERPPAAAALGPKIRPVKTVTLTDNHEDNFRYYPAKVRSAQRVKLAFQVPGQITRFPVKAGDRVTRGQIIAELDPRDYQSALKSAIARYEEAKADYQRYSRLVEKRVVSIADYESKRKTFDVAEAEMKIAEKALSDTRLRASFDGIVAGIYVDNFENVQAKQSILSLQDISGMEFVINVPERDIIMSPGIRPMDELDRMYRPVAIFSTIPEKEFPLKLKEFEIEADADTQTFRIILTMPTPTGYAIMPGMTALVRVLHYGGAMSELKGLWVPVGAVGNDGGGAYVWLIDKDMTAHLRRIKVGMMCGDRILVESGLHKGETIAAAGVHFLREGMKVKKLVYIGKREIGKLAGGK